MRTDEDMLAEAVVLLTAHAKERGLEIVEESTDVRRVLMLARSIRFGWPAR